MCNVCCSKLVYHYILDETDGDNLDTIEAREVWASDFIKTANHLDSPEARKKWENAFDKYYIQPILRRLDAHLDAARELLANDETQGKTMIMTLNFASIVLVLSECRT